MYYCVHLYSILPIGKALSIFRSLTIEQVQAILNKLSEVDVAVISLEVGDVR